MRNLRFAYDMILIGKSLEELISMITELQSCTAKIGLKLNILKTKIMTGNSELKYVSRRWQNRKLRRGKTFWLNHLPWKQNRKRN